MDRKSFIKSIAALPFIGIAAVKGKIKDSVTEPTPYKDLPSGDFKVTEEVTSYDTWTAEYNIYGNSHYCTGSSSSDLTYTTADYAVWNGDNSCSIKADGELSLNAKDGVKIGNRKIKIMTDADGNDVLVLEKENV